MRRAYCSESLVSFRIRITLIFNKTLFGDVAQGTLSKSVTGQGKCQKQRRCAGHTWVPRLRNSVFLLTVLSSLVMGLDIIIPFANAHCDRMRTSILRDTFWLPGHVTYHCQGSLFRYDTTSHISFYSSCNLFCPCLWWPLHICTNSILWTIK